MSHRTSTRETVTTSERITRPTYGARVRDAERGKGRNGRKVTRRDRVRESVPRDLQV